MTRRRIILLALVVVAALGIAAALPPRPIALVTEALVDAPVVRGAYHVHSNRSDGTGSIPQIAAAAGRAGLSFVIVTDHGDATRAPDPPVYLDGVLVIDAVEISTDAGHVVALGMAPSPYPLAGEPRDVVADIARLNGISIAAHPGSPKAGLRWTDWTTPIDGLEWLNGDSQWRDEGAGAVARAILTYPFRRTETLGALLDRPDEVIRQWEAMLAHRQVVALAAGDAHARLGLRSEPSDSRIALHLPAYEQVFRTASIGIPRLALAGDAVADAGAIVTAIDEGNVFSAVDAIARPAAFGFTAVSGGIRVGVGGRLPVGQPVELSVSTNAPPGARIRLLKGGVAIAESVAGPDGAMLNQTSPPGAAVYRVEVTVPGAPGTPPVPWILSNPIYVRPPEGALGGGTAIGRAAPAERSMQYADGPAGGWTVEQSARARGALDVTPTVDGTELAVRYALGGTREEGPFVAVTMPAGPLAGYDRLMFTARAARPMRLSVELRAPGGVQGNRWSESIYLDEVPRDVTVFFDEMTPRLATSSPQPDLARVDRVLFVVDTVHAAPGTSGQLWLDDVALAR
jgi:hypothetical protein